MIRSNGETRSASETPESSPTGRTTLKPRLNWIGLVSLMPIVFLIAIVCIIGYRETIASGELKAKLDEMRQAGEPFDDESMAKYFKMTLHEEGTAAWTEILNLSRAANSISDKLPVVGVGNLPSDLRPGSEWPEEPRVAEFLEEVRPLIQRIFKADAFPKPVWMPIQFNGFGTLLDSIQESRVPARILNIDAIHALYHKDGDRALMDIHAIRSVAQAFDRDICVLTRMVSVAIHGSQRDIINRSLSMDVWNEEQLIALSNHIIHPYEASKAWKASIAGERGMAYSVLSDLRKLGNAEGFGSNPLFGLPVMPSTKLTVLRAYEDLQHCSDAGDARIVELAKSAQARFQTNLTLSTSNMFIGMMMPAIASYAEMFDRFETNRRLTYTALAVKRYQVKNNRWPKSLSELSDVGLVANDWTTTNRQSFGYEVVDEMAYVWTFGTLDRKTVPSKRPQPDPSDADAYLENLVSIR